MLALKKGGGGGLTTTLPLENWHCNDSLISQLEALEILL